MWTRGAQGSVWGPGSTHGNGHFLGLYLGIPAIDILYSQHYLLVDRINAASGYQDSVATCSFCCCRHVTDTMASVFSTHCFWVMTSNNLHHGCWLSISHSSRWSFLNILYSWNILMDMKHVTGECFKCLVLALIVSGFHSMLEKSLIHSSKPKLWVVASASKVIALFVAVF